MLYVILSKFHILLGGKTEFIIQLIENRQKLFTSEFSRIIFCQPESLAHRQNQAFERKNSAKNLHNIKGIDCSNKATMITRQV